MRNGFTLVELLVVVTIIVILLALLTPALDRAVYQAELAQCAATLKATGTSAATYAMNSRRHYPHRPLPRMMFGSTVKQADAYITPRAIARPANDYDIRPPLRGWVNINNQLQCPLTPRVELDDTEVDVAIDGSYATWWDWHYETTAGPQRAMTRLGDRWEWTESGQTQTFNVLAGDFDIYFAGQGYHGSHPDDEGRLYAESGEGVVGWGTRATFTLWWNAATGGTRGLIDMNHVFDDGSVQRYNAVKKQEVPAERDSRMARVPLQSFNQQELNRLQVPRR
jgi:prepilin-type N-terminal cleavage/methylation domain-containing protein